MRQQATFTSVLNRRVGYSVLALAWSSSRGQPVTITPALNTLLSVPMQAHMVAPVFVPDLDMPTNELEAEQPSAEVCTSGMPVQDLLADSHSMETAGLAELATPSVAEQVDWTVMETDAADWQRPDQVSDSRLLPPEGLAEPVLLSTTDSAVSSTVQGSEGPASPMPSAFPGVPVLTSAEVTDAASEGYRTWEDNDDFEPQLYMSDGTVSEPASEWVESGVALLNDAVEGDLAAAGECLPLASSPAADAVIAVDATSTVKKWPVCVKRVERYRLASERQVDRGVSPVSRI
jgi:hypothetical protein